MVIFDRRKRHRYESYSLSLTAGDRPPKMFKTGIEAIMAAKEYVAVTGNTCPIYGWNGMITHQIADVKADGTVVQ